MMFGKSESHRTKSINEISREILNADAEGFQYLLSESVPRVVEDGIEISIRLHRRGINKDFFETQEDYKNWRKGLIKQFIERQGGKVMPIHTFFDKKEEPEPTTLDEFNSHFLAMNPADFNMLFDKSNPKEQWSDKPIMIRGILLDNGIKAAFFETQDDYEHWEDAIIKKFARIQARKLTPGYSSSVSSSAASSSMSTLLTHSILNQGKKGGAFNDDVNGLRVLSECIDNSFMI